MNSGYRSENKGTSFSKDSNFSYSNKVIMNDDIIWSAGSSFKFSTDGGTTWTTTTEKNSDSVNNGDGLYGFYAIGNKAWAVTAGGKIFYY